MESHCPRKNHTAATPRGLTVAGLLERYLHPFLDQDRDQVTPHQLRVLTRLIDCQTAQAGTHAWRCQHCGHCSVSNNWCGDRHCLNCYAGHRMDWLDQMKTCTLPCVYLHIVFTLPHEFHDLAGSNRKRLYSLLFHCAMQSLLRQMREVFGVTPGITAALHTWGSVMLEHFHIHIVMSCGGLTLDGTRWIDVHPNDPRLSREALAPRYRALFLSELVKLYRKGKITLPASISAIQSQSDFDAWLEPIAAKDWMVNVQPPPPDSDGPATALGYLGRYVAGTCVGDTRILEDDGTHVTIRVKNYRQEGREETLRLAGIEFVRRFTLHIVPAHCRRIRHAGLLCQRRRTEYLAICRELLKDRIHAEPADATADGDEEGEFAPQAGDGTPDTAELEPPRRCPRCLGREFIFIECYWPDQDYRQLRSDTPRTREPRPRTARAPAATRPRPP